MVIVVVGAVWGAKKLLLDLHLLLTLLILFIDTGIIVVRGPGE